jgi:hypothetical protein
MIICCTSDWVLQKVKDCVGISCEGFEEENKALFTAIEASHYEDKLDSFSNPAKKGKGELKRLACSFNYDFEDRSSSQGRELRGRVFQFIMKPRLVP